MEGALQGGALRVRCHPLLVRILPRVRCHAHTPKKILLVDCVKNQKNTKGIDLLRSHLTHIRFCIMGGLIVC